MERLPRVSIGMPAFNSEANIGSTIECFLAQTFGDFELIVSDNASIDGTREVVERYRAVDKRVRYQRQPVNVGANPNYTHVARLARGEFFKWSSSSDWCAPTFLEACINLLVRHEDTVVVVPRARLFEHDPSSYRDYEHDIDVLDAKPSDRLVRLMETLFLNNVMNGLIRGAALRRTRLMEPFYGGDVVLMGHLALLGKFRLVDQRLFYRRMEVATSTAMQDRLALRRHHYPQLRADSLLQYSKLQLGWLRVVRSAPIGFSEKVRALTYVAKRCYWERHLFKDDLRGVWDYLTREVSH
ncbi:MAG: glycosyltransferase family 2 protein [Rhodocyclaceae bacterium]|uniref:glycosyltransferase family 2 protein n=1 Tax=Accumulibacter sp. TaxID=2053492 RepID=UPI001A61C8D0|nr:glycosyltransferase family 2 protein [Accumulibacter sp.]MBL8495651.1 glycosyltransferase family 2 protein [Rhodocyclaceae bacterium]HNB66613.1 glycosyltransferase family 2 protein [Accumulibacter sp.]